MSEKPAYEELEQRFKEMEKVVVELKSEKKKLSIMQDAVASSINAIGITDRQGKMKYVNDSCIKMWGYDHENEILGRSLSEFWEGDGILNTIKELQEKGLASGEDIGKRKDGSLINVQFSANISKDEVGNPAYMFGSFFDITDRKHAEEALQQAHDELEQRVAERTEVLRVVNKELMNDIIERKRAEQALRESEGKYRNLIEQANDGIVILQDARVKFVNQRLADLLGYTREEMMDTPHIRYVHPELVSESIERNRRRTAGEAVETIHENILRHKNGAGIYVEVNAASILFEGEVSNLVFVRDITARKRAEEALRESEEKNRNLFNTAQVGLARSRISDGKVLECNQKMAEIFGYENVEDYNNEWVFSDNYVDPHIRESMLKEVKKTGVLNNAEVEFYGKDKTKVWTRFDTRILPEKGYMEDVVVDITDQKIAETALRESEEKYRRIFENSVVGFFQSTQEGRFISVNPAFAAMLRYDSPDELVSKIGDIATQYYADPEDRSRYKELLQKSGAVRNYEFKVKCKDGSQIWVSNSTRAYFKQDGTVDHYEGIVFDITNRKRVEEALYQSEEKYRILFESSKDASYITTREGTLVEANPSLQDLFGYSEEEISDWSAKDTYLNPDDRSRFRKAMRENGSVKDFEVNLLKKDGTVMDCLITATVRRSKEGDIAGYQGIIRDVTELKRAQEEREKLIKELQEALANVKTLSGLLPICSYCKKIRDDRGYYHQLESYIHKRSDAEFSHGICPDCAEEHFPDFNLYEDSE